MKLSIGIVGLPNVGKSTLFKALTKQDINIANYPFATIDPNIGIVSVPDDRLAKLTAMSASAKTIPAVIEFYDIAGLVKGASQGEGLGNQFLANIRETNAIVHLVRIFINDDIHHVDGLVNPKRDIEVINLELIIKDLATVEKRISSLEKEAKTGDKKIKQQLDMMLFVKKELLADKLIFNMSEDIRTAPVVRELNLLTAKPQIYLLNGSKSDIPDGLLDYLKSLNFDWLVADLSSLTDLGELIRSCYKTLDLISFFTTGTDETRAWTTHFGATAPVAAGAIHTDFTAKFIRAEVINAADLLELGSWSKAKQTGKLRLEGKEYLVQDGDVIEIRHG